MSWIGPVLGGVLSSVISSNAAKSAQASAQDAAAQQAQAAFQQQIAYIQQQEQALRSALQGITSHGNPFFQAGGMLQKPNPHQYAQPGGGGQVFGGGSGVPQQLSPQQNAASYFSLAPQQSNTALPPGFISALTSNGQPDMMQTRMAGSAAGTPPGQRSSFPGAPPQMPPQQNGPPSLPQISPALLQAMHGGGQQGHPIPAPRAMM